MTTTLSMNLLVGRAVPCAPNTPFATCGGAHGVTRPTTSNRWMRRLRCSFPLFLCSLSFFTHTTFAQTWQTVDDFQYFAGQSAGNGALAVLPSGTLLAAGYGYDAASVGHALVMSSADGGVTWSAPLDDFTGPFPGVDPRYLAVGSDPAGNLYAAGTYFDTVDPNGTDHWFVRRSADGGASWQMVDDIGPFSGSWFNQANAVAADAAG